MASQGVTCHACRHVNPAASKFCNQCGAELPAPEPEPEHVGGGTVRLAITELPRRQEGIHEEPYQKPLFYLYVFLALGVITLIEISVTRVGPPGFWVTALLVLSAAKFALVAMFFMHLFGDRRLIQSLFVAPLMIAMVIAVALVGLFQNF